MSGNDCFCLDPRYPTTRMVTKDHQEPEGASCSGELGQLFLPAGAGRLAEGGLRTKGYFKRGATGRPLITVITIVYNRCEHMAATIESVLAQTYDNMEYIIIDGGSTDGTVEVIQRYEEAIDYWISEPDQGIGDAFNKGVRASTGKWVNFMNCGDRFASADTVDHIVAHVDEKADVVFGRTTVVDDKGTRIVTHGRPFENQRLSRGMNIPHQSAFHNTDYFRDYGLFDTSFKTSMVYEMFMRKRPLSAIFVNEVASYMLVAGISETADYVRLKEARMIKQKHRPDLGSLVIQYDYYYGFIRALTKRALIGLGLGCVARCVRQVEGRLRDARP